MENLATSTETRHSAQQMPTESALAWLETVLPRIMRRLMDAENLDMPLLQLPRAGQFPSAPAGPDVEAHPACESVPAMAAETC